MTVKGSYPDSKKVTNVKGFPILKFITNVRAFLGFTRYYKRFILGYAKIVELLFDLTEKDCKLLWTPIC